MYNVKAAIVGATRSLPVRTDLLIEFGRKACITRNRLCVDLEVQAPFAALVSGLLSCIYTLNLYAKYMQLCDRNV
jgi:hypothetical protein